MLVRTEIKGTSTTISHPGRYPGTEQRAGCLLSKRRVGFSSVTISSRIWMAALFTLQVFPLLVEADGEEEGEDLEIEVEAGAPTHLQ